MGKKLSISSALKVGGILWPKFRVVGDLVFLESEAAESIGISQEASKTEIEASMNHVHILDLFSNAASMDNEPFWDSNHKDFQAACSFGKTWAQSLFAKLSKDFPRRRFRVYYTESDNPIVRFHQVHQGEAPWLSESDWHQEVLTGKVVVLDSDRA